MLGSVAPTVSPVNFLALPMIRSCVGRVLSAVLCLSVLLCVTSVPSGAAGRTHVDGALASSSRHPVDSSAVARTVDRFYTALVAGDSTTVAGLLAPDAIVLEGGGRETRLEYLGHHFHSDHAFLSALTRETESRQIRVEGDVAWVTSKGRLHGTFRDRAFDLTTTGLLVLRRTGGDWRIEAIHWSSRSRN